MVINKNMDEAITSLIDLKDFMPPGKANAWILNGPSVDATNEKKVDNVKVTYKEFEIKNNPFEFTFEPHSLTAIEIKKRE
jgi:alpha-L-arabinofuranosidase